MEDLLNRCGLKVNRSSEHLDALNASAESFFQTAARYRVVRETNSQQTKQFFRLDQELLFPDLEWGVIVGDAVHSMRSALDQLAYGLATDPSSRTQFPISWTRRHWVKDAPSMYRSVPDEYVDVIHELQPYHLGDAAHEHPLAVLTTLWNLDKHRTIPAMALVPHKTESTVTSVEGLVGWSDVIVHGGRPLKKGTVLAEVDIVPDGSGIEPRVNITALTTFDVGFGVIAEAPSITHTAVINWFNETLAPFVIKDIMLRLLVVYNNAKS
jgi:hypothetical protein